MYKTKVSYIETNYITGGEAIDYALEGNILHFPPGYGMKGLIYNDEVFSYYFVNSEGQLIRTNWNDAQIANRTWIIEEENAK